MQSVWRLVTDFSSHVMIERPVFEIYKDTEICKEFRANGWQTAEGYCLSQRNFRLLKKIYDTTQEIKILNKRVFRSHQKSLSARAAPAFTVTDEHGTLYRVDPSEDRGSFHFHHTRSGRDFLRPFEDHTPELGAGQVESVPVAEVKAEERESKEGDVARGVEKGTQTVEQRTERVKDEDELRCDVQEDSSRIRVEEPDPFEENPFVSQAPRPRPRPRPRTRPKRPKRYCRIDNSSVSGREASDLDLTPQKSKGLLDQANPFVKMGGGAGVGVVPEYASVQKVSHDEEDEDEESSTKKYLRLKQKLDVDFPIARVMEPESVFPRQKPKRAGYAGGDAFSKIMNNRQKRASKQRPRKKKISKFMGKTPKMNSQHLRQLHLSRKTENLSEYKKLLQEAQKLLSAHKTEEPPATSRFPDPIQVEVDSEREGPPQTRVEPQADDSLANKRASARRVPAKVSVECVDGDEAADEDKPATSQVASERHANVTIVYDEDSEEGVSAQKTDATGGQRQDSAERTREGPKEADEESKGRLETLSSETRKFIQQRIFYLNDKSKVRRFRRRGSFDFGCMKMVLECSDAKCAGQAEIALKEDEQKEIRIKRNCSINWNEHSYNYKRFFVRKIRHFDIVEEELSYPEIQKMVFRELFVHCFDLGAPRAMKLFQEKFGLQPVLSEKEVVAVRSRFLAELKPEAGQDPVDVAKKKVITRSRRFWAAFEVFLKGSK